MTELAIWLWTVALFVPQPSNERRLETSEQRAERVAVIARSIAEATDRMVMTGKWPGAHRRELAAAALATAVRESGGLSLRVHNGQRHGLAGEVCYMQINSTNRPNFAPFRHRELAGIDDLSSFKCALAGVRTLVAARQNCRGKVPPSVLLGGVLSRYLRGSRCNTSEEGRVRWRLARDFLSSKPLTSGMECPQWAYTGPKFSWVEGEPFPRTGGSPCRKSSRPESRISFSTIRKLFAQSSWLSSECPKPPSNSAPNRGNAVRPSERWKAPRWPLARVSQSFEANL